jgi:hypothetical protein
MLGRELRDAVFRLCTAAGGFLALLWDAHHRARQAPPSAAGAGACHSHHVAGKAAMTSLGHCVNEELIRVIAAWTAPIAVGLVLGASVGLALAFMIPLGRTRR